MFLRGAEVSVVFSVDGEQESSTSLHIEHQGPKNGGEAGVNRGKDVHSSCTEE